MRVSQIAIFDVSKAISRKRCKIGSKLVLITNRKSYMSFRLVPKLVALNDLERRNFCVRCRRKISGVPRFQNLHLLVYDHIIVICAIIQRLFVQNEL